MKFEIFPVVSFLGETEEEIVDHESGGWKHKWEAGAPHLENLL